jgi:K+-sensing histidine kinase KdpD
MARQVAQLSHLVDDLLDVTRITRNLITLKLEQVELNGLVYRTAVTTRRCIMKKELSW